MEKRCELCGDRATLYCAADDANVCWSCDAKVHSANFLVARHARSVLCSNCAQPTDCKTSGPHPSPLSRLCSRCNPSTVTRSIEEDCNGDSEEKENSGTSSYPSAATEAEESECTCASQESHTRRYTTGQGRRKQIAETIGRARGSRGLHAAESRRYGVHERGNRVQGRRIKKRSSSPVSVIPVDAVTLKLFKRSLTPVVVEAQTGLGIQALHLNACCHAAEEERLEGSGVGSNSVSPTNRLCSAPLIFELLEIEADEGSCVSYVDQEGVWGMES